MKSKTNNRARTVSYKVEVLFPDSGKPEFVEEIKVPVTFVSAFGEDEITSEGWDLIEQTKAKYLRRFSAKDVKELREALGLSGVEMSRALGLGDKTVARWESTGEWPSRSICALLNALRDGRIDIEYLNSLKPTRTPSQTRQDETISSGDHRWESYKNNIINFENNEAEVLAC